MKPYEQEIIKLITDSNITSELESLKRILVAMEGVVITDREKGVISEVVKDAKKNLGAMKSFYPDILRKSVDINEKLTSIKGRIRILLKETPSSEITELENKIQGFLGWKLNFQLGKILQGLQKWEKNERLCDDYLNACNFLLGQGRYGKRWSTMIQEIIDAANKLIAKSE